MDEIGVILGRFGDEESTLLDQYERLSFEVHLNQAILARSLSEPSTLSTRTREKAASLPAPPPASLVLNHHMKQGRPKSRFHKVLKMLMKPILGTKVSRNRKDVPDVKDKKLWKAFSSRSLRV